MAINSLIKAFEVIKTKLDKYIAKQESEVNERELMLSQAADDLRLANKLKTKLADFVV
ncbi:hypothetical protein [Brumicola nitratireducens]|uniref:Uncharacterized protein n=1 Tax=Glaciecola nitratireducens (strain JCM 12485 / KCTC 12276 / FR1064) TaxID=1085623 RepID=G4QGX2_GLANF|nr:hypothetical protein [Glaciecola nitratireducens]AEP29917.1 hypothetical protein GNIT_1807 [Glaciecola nitratireducens FR1064]